MAVIEAILLDEVHLHVRTTESVEKELKNLFSFEAQQAKYRQDGEYTEWDGVYRPYDPDKNKRNLYFGLFPRLEKFAKQHGHTIRKYRALKTTENKQPDESAIMGHFAENEDFYGKDIRESLVDEEQFREWIDGLEVGYGSSLDETFSGSRPFHSHAKAQEHEATAMLNALNRKRAVMLFRPEDNKHLVMCCLLRWFLKHDKKCLFLATSKMVVDRLYEGFYESFPKEVAFYMTDYIQKLYAGFSKEVLNRILLANWESVRNQPPEWFNQFHAVIVDEAHKFHLDSLIPLMEKMTQTRYRIGISNLTKKSKIHRLILEELFGTVENVWDKTKPREYQSDLNVTCIHLNYSNAIREARKNNKQHEEVKFLQQYEKRNEFICNLACELEGNTLVLVMNTSHGDILQNLVRKRLKQNGLKKELFVSAGPVSKGDEEAMRVNIEKNDECIVIASYKRMSDGFRIHSLDNIILASPYKTKIRNLGVMGSGLESRNTTCSLYDLMDDLSLENWENHLIKQAQKRIEVYEEEKKKGMSVKNAQVKIE